jgi:ATP:ADP antiporter, AAA family
MEASSPASPKPHRARFREHPLEFCLGLFAEVRPGEAVIALVLMITIFLLLLAYYMLKVAREPLILAGGGAEVKSYAAAGQSVLLVFFTAAYGKIAERVSRLRLVTSVMAFFLSNLAILATLSKTSVPLGVPFYLWVGVFNMSVVAQFWGFSADVLGDERGKRLFPILGIGSSSGAVAGAWAAKALVARNVGPTGLMVAAGATLVVCLFLMIWAYRHEHPTRGASGQAAKTDTPLGGPSGFSMLLQDKYLFWLGIFAIVLNAINSTGEYILDRVLVDAAKVAPDAKVFVASYKANYFGWVNAIGVVLQLFAVSRILRVLGLRVAIFIMPVVSLLGYSSISFVPILQVVFAAKLAENGLDYSLANTSRQSLWLPTSPAAKYKAKQVIDTFLVRVGDVGSALLVWVLSRLHAGTSVFAGINAALALVWILVLTRVSKQHKLLTEKSAA